MTTVNRKIRRGTYKHENNPIVEHYRNMYHIGTGLIFQVIRTYGDCKYSHDLCAKIAEFSKNNKCSGVKFNDIILKIGE